MTKDQLLILIEEIEKDKRKNRFFEKVSYEEFCKGVKSCCDIYNSDEIRQMYNDLPYPCRSTIHAGGYDFFAPYDFVLKPGETVVVPTGFRVHMNNDEIFNLFVLPRQSCSFHQRCTKQRRDSYSTWLQQELRTQPLCRLRLCQ